MAQTTWQKRWLPWMFCGPALGAVGLLGVLPLLRTVYLSFTDARLSTLGSEKWLGFGNFTSLLVDPDWWRSVFNTLVFAALSVSIETALGLVIALVLNRSFKGRGVLRATVLIPWAIPTVVSAKMWAWMFNDIYGVINELLLRTGIIHERLAWLADSKLALLVVVAVDVWKTSPFMALLILAALQGVPMSLYEAAALDGASSLQRFFYVTWPLIKPGVWVAVIFRTLDALRVFDLPFVLTSNSKTTAVMSVFARQQMVEFQDVGYGSAASVLVFLVIASITLVYLARARGSLGLEA